MKYILQSWKWSRKLHDTFNTNFKMSLVYISSKGNNYYTTGPYRKYVNNILVGSSLTALLLYDFYDKRRLLKCENLNVGRTREGLPYYTLQEVSEHTTKDKGIWVTYKEGVYDITDFVKEHPGGEQILMAAGSSVEPFWMLYAAHNDAHVLQILETLRIGNLSKGGSQHVVDNMADPYSTDPTRHAALKTASVKPFNAEPPLSLLVEHFITPNELFYVRNHLPVPQIDSETYELEIEIQGQTKAITLTLDDLKKFPVKTITATIMCAGNRRSEMAKVKSVRGLSWGAAAIGNATWTGVRLRDILKKVGVDENDTKFKHVQFEGIDFDPSSKSYGASIPFWKAMDQRSDVILVFEMNGLPLSRDHGFPIRVIVPGVAAARNVKWLGKIVVSDKESDSHWQQNDYKGFSPSVDWDTVDYTKSPAIQELPVISAICKPQPNEVVQVEDGGILVKGYAWSGGGQKIIRVDLTIDGGKTWHVANLDYQDSAEPPQHWSWTLWSARIPIKASAPRDIEIWAKAVDSSYNTQPESFENIWNFRGVLNNAYHRVTIKIK